MNWTIPILKWTIPILNWKRYRVYLRIIAIKWYSTLTRALELEPHQEIQLRVISRTLLFRVALTPFQRIYSVYFKPYESIFKVKTYNAITQTKLSLCCAIFFCWATVTSKNRIVIIQITVRCMWCNGYRRRKWTWWHGFKSWTRLIAFLIALIPLGKVWIQLFSLQLWVNSRTD